MANSDGGEVTSTARDFPIGVAQVPTSRHSSSVPPTIEDRCDWCYGPLTDDDLTTPLGQALGAAEAAACGACAARGDVRRPPDSLHPADVEVAGRDAWALAVGALLSSEPALASSSAAVLRRVAGYED